jgi:hypothetical protein
MHDAFELIGSLAATAWKILCAASVLGLGLLILDRRGRPRPVRQVRRTEERQARRAA